MSRFIRVAALAAVALAFTFTASAEDKKEEPAGTKLKTVIDVTHRIRQRQEDADHRRNGSGADRRLEGREVDAAQDDGRFRRMACDNAT